jgi:hypothetical protein
MTKPETMTGAEVVRETELSLLVRELLAAATDLACKRCTYDDIDDCRYCSKVAAMREAAAAIRVEWTERTGRVLR